MDLEDGDKFIRLDATESFRLGSILVDPSSRRVIGDNGEMLLEPRVMRVLIALTQANGSVVGHDVLIQRCWNGQVVGDNAIQRAVSKVRQFGSDFARGEFNVQTIRGVGYRLTSDGAQKGPVEAKMPQELNRRAFIAAVGGLGVLGAVAFLRNQEEPVDQRARALFERGEIARREEGCSLAPDQAPSLYRSAIGIAPRYAAPWGALALVAAKALDRNEDNARYRRTALSAAKRGAELDPGHPYPPIAIALIEPTYKRWSAQRERLEHLESRLIPGWDLPASIGFMAMCCGHLDSSINAFRRALTTEWNLPAVQFWLAHALLMAGRDEESLRIADEALLQSPNNWCSWETAFRTKLMSGNFEAASALVADTSAAPVNLHPQGRVPRLMLTRALSDQDAASRKKSSDYFRKTILEWPSYLPFAAAPLALLREFDLLTTAITGYLLSEGPMAVPSDWRRHPWFLYQPPLLELHDHPPVRNAMLQVGLEPWG